MKIMHKQVEMYFGAGTVHRIASGHCCVHSSDSSTFLHEIMSWPPSWKCDVRSKIRLYQL